MPVTSVLTLHLAAQFKGVRICWYENDGKAHEQLTMQLGFCAETSLGLGAVHAVPCTRDLDHITVCSHTLFVHYVERRTLHWKDLKAKDNKAHGHEDQD